MLSFTVSETVNVEWRDLEILVIGHSRLLKMVPFESLGTVSYSHFIATVAVSLAFSTQCTNMTVVARRHRPRLCIASHSKNQKKV